MDIKAVIGANYGDEGKGMFTEHLCRCMHKPAVVLSNGGCQRGHTVNNKERGIRHVFNHFGSGTLCYAPSVMSSTFLLNPVIYVKELGELYDMGAHPEVFRAPGCILQLPSDMFTNQMLERSRGESRHGSCGMGIWETKVRNASKKLTCEMFASMSRDDKKKTMEEALEQQLEIRLRDVEIDEDILKIVRSKPFIDHFLHDFDTMIDSAKLLSSDKLLDIAWEEHDIHSLVVENAQGLLLDMKYAPPDEDGDTSKHSTPSKTGLEGVLDALGCIQAPQQLVLNYISRSYLTRHGAGPFPEHDPSMSFNDATNVYNEYQGSIRFGKIDVDKLVRRVKMDSMNSDHVNIVATHLNQLENEDLKEVASFMSYDDDSRHFRSKSTAVKYFYDKQKNFHSHVQNRV